MYKIGMFSKKTNTSIKTLRYYDEINLFKPEYCDPFTGYRYYKDEQIDTMFLINKLKKINLSLSEIKSYLETKDINVITNKKDMLKMEIEKITNFLNDSKDKYDKYTIKKQDYQKYVEINGLKNARCYQALEIMDGNAQYYVIENDLKEFYDDFVIYINEENYISIERKKILDIYYIDFIIKFLKKENYEYITFIIPTYEEKIIDHIKENYKHIAEKNIMQSNWEYKKIKLYLN